MMWSEEELRNVEPDIPCRTGAKSLAGNLRDILAQRNFARATSYPHELSRSASPAVIYAPATDTHGNFIDASYRCICANPAWAARLRKPHTAKRQARISGPHETIRPWCELDSANSSDALLMNIFCFPGILQTPPMVAFLGIESGLQPVFGYPARIPLLSNRKDRTEIDLRLGHLLVEAKLTEGDFQFTPMRKLENYLNFHDVLDTASLEITPRGVRSYQLIRGVLAAYAEPNSTFCVLCDARRPDLIEAWYAIMRAVRSYQLQSRLRLLTWQELATVTPPPLRAFLDQKYAILPHIATGGN